MKTNPAPRLRPLLRRFGWFLGSWIWLGCRRNGCRWHFLPQSQQQVMMREQSGTVHAHITAKARCPMCESVRLLNIYVSSDGEVAFLTVPEIGLRQVFYKNNSETYE